MILNRRSLLSLTSGAALAATLPVSGALAQTTAPEIKDITLGDPNAKVKIDEFLSFTCPHCAHFHSDVFPKIKADYIDTGKANLTYHEVYFDQYGLLGAMVARCGGDLRYFGITDMLLDKQREWAGAADINAVVEQLKKIGRTAGLEDAAVDACLRDQAMAEALVTHYQTSLEAAYPNDSFEGTPSFIVNGTKHANMSYEEMKRIIDEELAK